MHFFTIRTFFRYHFLSSPICPIGLRESLFISISRR